MIEPLDLQATRNAVEVQRSSRNHRECGVRFIIIIIILMGLGFFFWVSIAYFVWIFFFFLVYQYLDG